MKESCFKAVQMEIIHPVSKFLRHTRWKDKYMMQSGVKSLFSFPLKKLCMGVFHCFLTSSLS